MKKVLSALLAFSMVLSVFYVSPFTAWADSPVQSSKYSDIDYLSGATSLQSGPANPRTPTTYYLDLNKEDYPLPVHRDPNYLQSVGILYPGDKLVIIPEVDPNPGTSGCHGLPGLYFSDRNGDGSWLELKEGDKYGPLRITGSVTLGSEVVHTYITEITVEDAPVMFKDRWAGGDNGAVEYSADYTCEPVREASYWRQAIIDYVELVKYHPVQYVYKYAEDGQWKEFSAEEINKTNTVNPTAIWTEDLSVTYTPNEGYINIGPEFTVSAPMIDGYVVYEMRVRAEGEGNYNIERTSDENEKYDSTYRFYADGAMDFNWTFDHKKYGSETDPITVEVYYYKGTTLTLNAMSGTIDGKGVSRYDYYYKSSSGSRYSFDFTLSDHPVIREGFDFGGWYADPAYTELVVPAGSDYSMNSALREYMYSKNDGNVILYAAWLKDGEIVHTHTMSAVAAKAPTCAEPGRNAYYYCAGCNKVFKDSAGMQETTVNAETIAATGKHMSDEGTVTKKATPTATGTRVYKCTVCGQTLKIETISKTAKYANTLTVKAKKPSVKYSKLKKKNQTIALKNWVTVSKAQGKVTYKKSSGNKKITVSKAGKITVKKGLKKGTYKVKIKVTAAGNANYKAKTKTVTVKIIVK